MNQDYVGLRDYQDVALTNMKNGCILNGGVGSGKSRTALSYYYVLNGGILYYNKYNEISGLYDLGPYEHDSNVLSKNAFYHRMINPIDLYIITTAHKRDTYEWDEELKPFKLSTNPDTNNYKNKVIIDSWNNISKYVEAENAFFIFDEQRVIGSGTWVKSFLKIAKHNQWILLSATPGDQWKDYIPVFIANGFYKNKTDFCNRHVVWSRFTTFPKIEKYVHTAKLLQLRNNILVNMDFKRSTVQHHEHIICKYDAEMYNLISKSRWNIFKNEPIRTAGEFCGCLIRLCNSDVDRQIKLLEILVDHPKAIIFYNYDYELEILRNILKDYPHAEWNGHKHEDIPVGDSWAYLVQYTAGCEGWNCVTTDTIIFYSQNYSYRVMEQASGRIDRLNTPFVDLYYFHMRSESKIENAIRLKLRTKKKFNERDFAPDFKKENKDGQENLNKK